MTINDLVDGLVAKLLPLQISEGVRVERRNFAAASRDSLLVAYLGSRPSSQTFNGFSEIEVDIEIAFALQDPRSDWKALDLLDKARVLLADLEPLPEFGYLTYRGERLQVFQEGLTLYLAQYLAFISSGD